MRGWSSRIWESEQQGLTGRLCLLRSIVRDLLAASKSVHWAESVVQLDVIAMATKDRRREEEPRSVEMADRMRGAASVINKILIILTDSVHPTDPILSYSGQVGQ
ncbi:hypothetical protein INR49_028089 [Caranx melampygus]|nr:hypothetical protein INR49_028089 [Caranx melampygus]